MKFANYGTIHDIYDRFDPDHAKDVESYKISHWNRKENQEMNFYNTNKMLKGKNVKSLLDIGCGLGDLEKFIDKDIEYHGIDIVENIVKIANDRNPDRDVKLGDIFKYDMAQKFDAVICNGSFNMLYDTDKVVEGLKIMDKLSNKISILTASYVNNEDIKKFKSIDYKILQLRMFAERCGDDLMVFKDK